MDTDGITMGPSRLSRSSLYIALLFLSTSVHKVSSVSVAAGNTYQEHEEICRLTLPYSGKKRNTPCKFPFKFEGVTYDGVCTNKDDPNGKYWCSTKTDENGLHLSGGNWGFCNDGCDKKPSRTIAQGREECKLTLSDDGPKQNAPCAWPFKYKGVLYDGVCTNEGDENGRYWCSTKTRKRGPNKHRHVTGGRNWGYCQPSCNIVPGDAKPQKTTTPAPTSAPERARKNQKKTPCKGPYCDKDFWNIKPRRLKRLETRRYNWIDFNKKTEAGDYLPNPFDGSCGDNTKSGYIVGGNVTKLGEFPYVAAIGYRDKCRGEACRVFYNCGGSLINRRYVISAAHCHNAAQKKKSIAKVVIGDHDLSTNPDCGNKNVDENKVKECTNKPIQTFDVTVNDVIVHEGWDPAKVKENANDILLIRLPKLVYTYYEIAGGVHVAPVCLPWGSISNGQNVGYPSDTNLEYIVTGWGRTNNNAWDSGETSEGGAHSNLLLRLNVPFIPTDECKEKFKSFAAITSDKQICAGGEKGKDSCNGDSGGPLILREDAESPMFLRGIVSFGTAKCGKGYPGVYTDVEYYIPWIRSKLKR